MNEEKAQPGKQESGPDNGVAGIISASLASHFALLKVLIMSGAVDPDRYLDIMRQIQEADQSGFMKSPGAEVVFSTAKNTVKESREAAAKNA
jgi:hypothetical protein